MPLEPVRDGKGKLRCMYDADLDILEFKDGDTLVQLSLEPYRKRAEARRLLRRVPLEVPLDIAAQS